MTTHTVGAAARAPLSRQQVLRAALAHADAGSVERDQQDEGPPVSTWLGRAHGDDLGRRRSCVQPVGEPRGEGLVTGVQAVRISDLDRGGLVAASRDAIEDPGWANWASRLVSTTAVEGVIAWLGAGQPDPASAAQRIGRALGGTVQAAQSASGGGSGLLPGCS